MIVVDTHVWIWMATDPEQIGRRARSALRRATRIGVPAIACWEVAVLAEQGRIEPDREVTDWIHQALTLPAVELLPITPEVAVRAGQLLSKALRDPVDLLIAATAQVHAAPLVTKDRKLRAAPGLTTIW